LEEIEIKGSNIFHLKINAIFADIFLFTSVDVYTELVDWVQMTGVHVWYK